MWVTVWYGTVVHGAGNEVDGRGKDSRVRDE